MGEKRYLVTAGLPYSNGPLHVGHVAGAYLPADIYVRYLRMQKRQVLYVCGSDDNGVASLISARKEGKTVEELTQFYNHRQDVDFKGLGIKFDVYGGTHQPHFVKMHEIISQDFFKTIYNKNLFVKRVTEQLYDESAKQFLPDRYVKGTCYYCQHPEAYGDQCEACGQTIDPLKLINPISTITNTTPVPRQTTHWYLPLDQFQGQLKEWLESKRTATEDSPAWRDMTLNFALGQIKQGLPERAMTRDLNWGIPVPLDDPDAKGKMIYVWFEAPIGYVSFTAQHCQDKQGEWQNYEKWWKDPDTRIVHFIGEDNTIFHCLLWPAMMLAEGSYQLPWQVVVNAFLNIKFPGQDEQKISKSRGTAIWIEEYLKMFEPDPLRYYLTAIAPENQRTTFDVDDFITRNNNELLNALGNFVNRSFTFSKRYFNNLVPELGELTDVDKAHLTEIETRIKNATENIEKFRFKAALNEIMTLARSSNVYFDTKQPWKQAKENLAACATTVNISLQTIKALTITMSPFLPFTAEKCMNMLNLPLDRLTWNEAGKELPAGHNLGEQQILFTKLDAASLFSETPAESKSVETKVDENNEITYDDFMKIDLRVAEILTAERVKGADKLVQLKIKVGAEERQLVAGIAQHYTPEELIGKQIVIVANLKPAKIRGIESKGMLLAASDSEKLALVTPEKKVETNSRVK